MLLRGFTTVRDTGGASKSLALALEEGLIPGPRLFQCGKALSQTGGHGDFNPSGTASSSAGCCGGASHADSLGRVADGVPDVLRAVREELKGGADFIKGQFTRSGMSCRDRAKLTEPNRTEPNLVDATQ